MMPFRFFGWVLWYMVMPLTEAGTVKQEEYMLPGRRTWDTSDTQVEMSLDLGHPEHTSRAVFEHGTSWTSRERYLKVSLKIGLKFSGMRLDWW